MGYEIVLATIAGSIGSIAGLLLYQHGVYKKMGLEHDYNIKRYKLGKRYKLKEMDLPKKQSKGILEQLRGLDKDTISRALDFLQPSDEVEDDEGLEGILRNLIANNPDMVNQFLTGLSKGTKKQEDHVDIYES